MSDGFGITVRRTQHETKWEPDNSPDGGFVSFRKLEQPLWSVGLPHQCDEWDIALKAPQAEAISALEQFIAEAQQGLVALREGRPDYDETEGPNGLFEVYGEDAVRAGRFAKDSATG